MKANDKAVLAWMLVFAAFVLGSSTMLFILYHEWMHIVAYGMMGIEAHLDTPTTIDAARPHAWGLWAAYPMEIMSWAILGWFIAKAKHWWIAGFPLGFALGRVLYAVGSHDYNRIALQYGPEVPGTFKGLFVMFVLPLFAIVAYLAFRRARERYGEDRAYDTVQEARKGVGS